jgi:hypothetical protein
MRVLLPLPLQMKNACRSDDIFNHLRRKRIAGNRPPAKLHFNPAISLYGCRNTPVVDVQVAFLKENSKVAVGDFCFVEPNCQASPMLLRNLFLEPFQSP